MKSIAKHVVIMLFALLATACGGRKGNNEALATGMNLSEAWNANEGIYEIPDMNLAYIPPERNNTIIADPSSLPDNILMCMIDSVEQVSVNLIRLSSNVRRMDDAKHETEKIIHQNYQSPDESTPFTLDSCNFLNEKAWLFSSTLHVPLDSDSLNVIYTGYLFGNNALVVTAPESIAHEDLLNYVRGLKVLKNQINE